MLARRLLAALAALLVVAGAAGAYYLRSIGFWGSGEPRGSVSLTVPRGADATEIGELLEDREVIPSAQGFRLAVYLEGGAEDIQAGRYTMSRSMSARAALAALLKGPEIEFSTVTFPEGAWLTDFARILHEATGLSRRKFLELVAEGGIRSRLQPEEVDTLEGLLWPSTYRIAEHEGPRDVAARLVREFESRAASAGLAEIDGYSPYEAVIVASMVEAEAAIDAERPKIAQVIYNRLDVGMALQIDATVSYALGEHKQVLTSEDLAVASPYNTRVVQGLPPTPIGAPGLESLRAAARPAGGEWLYYVLRDCDGHHAFSVSYEDFLVDKAAYQALEC
jgi:UPF0755 protein